jgi:spore germination protein YaaH
VIKKLLIIIFGLLFGFFFGYLFIVYPTQASKDENIVTFVKHQIAGKQVIGFLPYWLLSKAQTDYSPYISTLTYFGLTIDNDGHILKMQNEQENDPGWYALKSGKVDPFLNKALEKRQKLSLLVFSGQEEAIGKLLENPTLHAQNLIADVKPIMSQYKFTDLNLDIESVVAASDEARVNFAQFVKEVKKGMDQNKLGTVTLDISGDSFIKKRLIDIKSVASSVDYVVIMGYDYHYIGSQVSGPVAPLFGAGTVSEYDVNAATQIALQTVPASKIILGVPLYGYQWETIRDATRSATIPSSGQTASTKRISELLSSCSTCSAQTDTDAYENYLVYKDEETGTNIQIFYPDSKATQAKIDFAREQKLAGLALWALGYEDDTILNPLKEYK